MPINNQVGYVAHISEIKDVIHELLANSERSGHKVHMRLKQGSAEKESFVVLALPENGKLPAREELNLSQDAYAVLVSSHAGGGKICISPSRNETIVACCRPQNWVMPAEQPIHLAVA